MRMLSWLVDVYCVLRWQRDRETEVDRSGFSSFLCKETRSMFRAWPLWPHLTLKKEREREVVSNSCNLTNCSPPGSSVHGILQARILEWVAISFSRGTSRPRNWTQVSSTAGRCFNNWPMKEAPFNFNHLLKGLISIQSHWGWDFNIWMNFGETHSVHSSQCSTWDLYPKICSYSCSVLSSMTIWTWADFQ